VFLKTFKISKYPITNSDYSEFIQDTKYITTAEKEGTGFVFDPKFRVVKKATWEHPFGPNSNLKNKEKHPVVQVSWFDALAFCKWLEISITHRGRMGKSSKRN